MADPAAKGVPLLMAHCSRRFAKAECPWERVAHVVITKYESVCRFEEGVNQRSWG